MFRSFIIGFLFTVSLLFGCRYCADRKAIEVKQLQIAEVVKKHQQVKEVFPLKNSKTCNNVEAIADIMFGEGENQTLDAKYSLAYFLINQSILNNRTLCEELTYRMPGGALKYSSMHSNLKNLKRQRAKSYANILSQAKTFWQNKEYLNYKKMQNFNHYITIKMAINNPPEWFKYYIIGYKVSGDHVFVNLDFKDKKAKKYTANYWKMVSTFKKS